MRIIRDTKKFGMSHKEINTLHSTAFLVFVSFIIAKSPITLLVCPSSSSLIVLRREHVEFSAGDVRTEGTIDGIENIFDGHV